MKRPPLWTTLIPLIAAGAGYFHWWSLQRDAFVGQVAAIVGAGGTGGGFPYRIETTLTKPDLRFDRVGVVATLRAEQLQLNRQPLRAGPVIGQMSQPRVTFGVPAIAGAQLDIEAGAAVSSLRMAAGHIERFSTVFDAARLRLAGFAAPVRADSFEVHVRETPTLATVASSPKFPVQDELVLAATALRYGAGDPVRLAASIDLTAAKPVRDLERWQAGGTLEVRRFQLADQSGEILNLEATGSPARNGDLLFAGTIETLCPATVEALFAGRTAARELRARRPIRYSFVGRFGQVKLSPVGVSRVPVRNQEPPCPVLRR